MESECERAKKENMRGGGEEGERRGEEGAEKG